LIPDNCEILLKLAGAIFQEMPDTADNNSRVMEALDRIIEIEPSSEALILKGKLLHRKEDYKAAIPVLD